MQEHQEDYDIENEQFAKVVEAIGMYARIEGIVNADTTEMAFLDKFRGSARAYLENHNADPSPKEVASRAWLQAQLSGIRERLSGTLDQTMTKEELEAIDKQTVSYVEDTTYSSNMEDSNIADIPLFTYTPNINDVRQGAVGDCWLASAISSVVNTNPEFIRSMFYDLGDGNVNQRNRSISSCGNIMKPAGEMRWIVHGYSCWRKRMR